MKETGFFVKWMNFFVFEWTVFFVFFTVWVFVTTVTEGATWYPLGKGGAKTYWSKKKVCEREEGQRCYNLRGHNPSDFSLVDGKWKVSKDKKAKRVKAEKARLERRKQKLQRRKQRKVSLESCMEADSLKGAQLKACIGLLAREVLDDGG